VVVFRWGLYHRRLVQDALVRPMPIYGRINCIHTLVITVTSRFLIINNLQQREITIYKGSRPGSSCRARS
jgi:hypothetical protein